ncbi:hypothetical protein KFZ70_04255 [Tamlana fucoidanivorans]|uniref:Uncharacterized protein n=1 Tax=Allotamlana fucoidanivorans TaxID=2583814 RepID=A0A5C4SCP9_9FLAO|nr:hypothetical protein [Tamlana fucoidanivorans]TNJ41344.1 hypothetical protein FGF67_16050 [Tamlana fucoidanivorans]
MIKERINTQTAQKHLGHKHYEAIVKVDSKLIKLQDLYIDGDIGKLDYETAKQRYNNILDELKEKEIRQKETSVLLDTNKNGLKNLIALNFSLLNLT